MNSAASPSWMHRLAALALLALVIGGCYVLATRVWIGQYRLYQTNAERLQDRLHHLQRLATARPELERAIQSIRSDPRTAAYFLPPAPPALAAADLQQRIKTLVESTGGSLLSVQALPAAEEGGVMRVAVNADFQGSTDSLQKTLHSLESQVPLLFVDNLELTARPIRPRLPDGNVAPYTRMQLNGQFQVTGYLRNKEGG